MAASDDWGWLDHGPPDLAWRAAEHARTGAGSPRSEWLSGEEAFAELQRDELFAGGASPLRNGFDSDQQPAALGRDFSPGRYFARKSLASPSQLGLSGPLSPSKDSSHLEEGPNNIVTLSTALGNVSTHRIALENHRRSSSQLSLIVSPHVPGFSARLVSARLRAGESTDVALEYRPKTEFDGLVTITVRCGDTGLFAQLPVRLQTFRQTTAIVASLQAVDFGLVDYRAGGASVDYFIRNPSPWPATLKFTIERESHSSCFSVEGPSLLEPGARSRVIVDFLPVLSLPSDTRYSCALVITAYFPHSARRWSIPCRATSIS